MRGAEAWEAIRLMLSDLITWLMQPCTARGSDGEDGPHAFPGPDAMAFSIGGEIGVQPFLSQALVQRARNEVEPPSR